MAQFGVQRPNTLVFNTGFSDEMYNRNDPRYYTFQSGGAFFTAQTAAKGGLFWSVNNAPSPLISYTEVMFLKAEALARTNDMAGADAALNEAVTSNIDYVGAEAKIDDLSGTPGLGAAYTAFYLGTIPNLTTLTQEAAIDAIMLEAYVGLYGQAEVEVWTNYRRTGYPALTPDPNGANGNDPSGVIPRRITYPQNERVTNKENLDAAKAAQGGALLDADLWAFK
jgi:hypothetical protein